MSMSKASKHEKGGACNIHGKYEKWRTLVKNPGKKKTSGEMWVFMEAY